MKLFLEVTFVEQTCLFKLYGEGREHEPARIPYTETLTAHYHSWQKAYLAYYRSLSSDMRGRAESGVGKMPDRDWRAELVKEEAMLLAEFNRWLKHEKLNKIRDVISRCAIEVQAERKSKQKDESAFVNLFITCHPGEESSLDLAKLPWEGWEVGREFNELMDGQTIRIARKPTSIQAGTVKRPRRDRLRVLAIFGDDTQLDFKSEKAELNKVSGAYIRIVDRHSCPATIDLQEYICREIADSEGWDILFFAGHSNEARVVNGELSIAPGKALMIHEIAPQLKAAKEQGLQFAIFNSCKGLDIANALIELGLSQVAIMREPIHNSVAEQFLIAFLKAMINREDVHSAVLFACEQFKDSRITYPSAHLIPSLFRHPNAELFRLPHWQHSLRRFLPRRKQAIALSIFAFLSLLPPVQQALIQSRQVAQIAYRELRQQVATPKPPILLVQIDQKAAETLDARKVYPIDRAYVARLIQRAQTIQPEVIGIDYIFDSPEEEEDPALRQQIQQATGQKTTIVLANTETPKSIVPAISSLDRVQQGYVNAYPFYIELPSQECKPPSCPFSFAIAKASNFRGQDLKLSPITSFSQAFGQNWLQPIVDFSISPNEAYQAMSAAVFLKQTPSSELPKTVIIAPGNYERAGITGHGEDIIDPPPLPVEMWRPNSVFTGGEFHAYMVHHLLNNRLVIPIPDLWVLMIAAVLGRMAVLMVQDSQIPRKRVLVFFVGGTLLWGWIGLELYLSAGLLVPWLIPSIVFWMLTMPLFRRKGYRSRLV